MNPVVEALTTGATALASAGGAAAVRELYDRLVAAVRERVGGDDRDEADRALEMLEGKPQSEARQAVVGELLDDAGAADDPQLLALARQLLEQAGDVRGDVEATQTATGRNVVQQVGDGHAAIVDRSRNR